MAPGCFGNCSFALCKNGLTLWSSFRGSLISCVSNHFERRWSEKNRNEHDSSSLLASLGRSPWLFSSLVAYPEVSHTLCSWEPLAQEVRGGEGSVGDGPGWFSPAKPRHCFSRHPLRPSGPNGNSLGHKEERELFVRRQVWWAISVLASWEQPSEKQHVPNARLVAHLSFRHACF